MNKSTQISADRPASEIDHRYQYVPSEHTPIRNTFERIRTQLAQEAEQKSRPVSRLYSGFRAVKAWFLKSCDDYDPLWHSNPLYLKHSCKSQT